MRPALRLLRLALLWLAVALACVPWPALLPVWTVAGLVLFLVAAADLRHLARRPPLEVERRMASSLALGVSSTVRIHLHNPSPHPIDAVVFDGCPPDAVHEDLPQRHTVPAEGWLEMQYRVRLDRRGDERFEPVHVLRRSALGLWSVRERLGAAETVQVYPNFAAVARYALLALENRVDQMGIRKKPRRGTGMDFHQLREYREGDVLRQIDWKATSRRLQLISREYQEERDQQVLFVLDCGRRMRSSDEGLSHFDHCLNAVLLLSYIALRQGDAVGFLTFGGAERWLPPVKGRAGLNTILNHVYDLETTPSPPDFAEAAQRAMTLQRRRALVCVLTNLRDEDAADLLPALHVLRRRHLVVLASLRETQVEHALERPVRDFADAKETAATRLYLEQRAKAIEGLQGRQVLAMDVRPRELPTALANQYLDIKRAGRL